MELLPAALIPFVEKRLETSVKGHWQIEVVQRVQGLKPNSAGEVGWDQQGLLKTMMAFWKDAFASVLGHPERSYVSELLDVRNKLSHNETFTYDDAERALDTMRRLMESISAGEVVEQLSKMRDTILRTKFTELQRNEERRKTQRLDISVETVAAGSSQVSAAGQTMEEIVVSVQRVADIMGEISAASAQQAGGIDQVSLAVSQMDEVTQQNAALVEEASAAASAMEDQARRLAEATAVFKTQSGQVIEVAPVQVGGRTPASRLSRS